MQMSHVTYINESCQKRMRHVTHTNESIHTYACGKLRRRDFLPQEILKKKQSSEHLTATHDGGEQRNFCASSIVSFNLPKTHLHHSATRCNTLQNSATRYNTLQHTATHCNTLTAKKMETSRTFASSLLTRCNTLQPLAAMHTEDEQSKNVCINTATLCNTLQHSATLCNTLQHSATYCNTHRRWTKQEYLHHQ